MPGICGGGRAGSVDMGVGAFTTCLRVVDATRPEPDDVSVINSPCNNRKSVVVTHTGTGFAERERVSLNAERSGVEEWRRHKDGHGTKIFPSFSGVRNSDLRLIPVLVHPCPREIPLHPHPNGVPVDQNDRGESWIFLSKHHLAILGDGEMDGFLYPPWEGEKQDVVPGRNLLKVAGGGDTGELFVVEQNRGSGNGKLSLRPVRTDCPGLDGQDDRLDLIAVAVRIGVGLGAIVVAGSDGNGQ